MLLQFNKQYLLLLSIRKYENIVNVGINIQVFGIIIVQ